MLLTLILGLLAAALFLALIATLAKLRWALSQRDAAIDAAFRAFRDLQQQAALIDEAIAERERMAAERERRREMAARN